MRWSWPSLFCLLMRVGTYPCWSAEVIVSIKGLQEKISNALKSRLILLCCILLNTIFVNNCMFFQCFYFVQCTFIAWNSSTETRRDSFSYDFHVYLFFFVFVWIPKCYYSSINSPLFSWRGQSRLSVNILIFNLPSYGMSEIVLSSSIICQSIFVDPRNES